MQCLYRDDEVTFYIGFSLCSVLYIVCLGSSLRPSAFMFFPAVIFQDRAFEREKKAHADTLVLLVTNYKQKQKHVIRGITCVAVDCVSFQKTECSQT